MESVCARLNKRSFVFDYGANVPLFRRNLSVYEGNLHILHDLLIYVN